jgi:catechol 2,3-dioxygenase-like lactoylglutathione lyase family enzyme
MIKDIAVITVWSEKVTETAHFYRDVLGLELLPHHHRDRPHFKVGGAYLTIIKGKPQPAQDAEPPRFPIFALRVSDLDQAVARLKANGVELPWDVEGTGNNRWVMFYDPGGNLVELI